MITHLNRYEKLILQDSQLPSDFRNLLAKVSKDTRLQSKETSFDKQVIWDTTASAIAPILFGFVHWCLVEAKKRGIKRLYFVARDGQILHKIAQIICKNWEYNIECRYFYGSRQAWHAPALMQVGEAELAWIIEGTTFLSVHSVCERVNITPEQIKDVLERFDFAKSEWNRNLNRNERDQLKQVFREAQVVELILATAATYRERAIGYFRQEKIGDGLPFAIVDIGWLGRAHRSFSNLLKSAGLYPESGVYGFYFGLEKQLKALSTDQLLAFYTIEKPGKHISQYRHIIEMFVSADHGGTMKYEMQGDGYIPVLRYQKNQTAIDWGLYILQNAVVEFTQQLTINLSESDCSVELFLISADILVDSLIYHPSFEESKVFGSFLIADDQAEKVLYELAPAYSVINCLKLLIFGKQSFNGAWTPASVARSNIIFRIILNPNILSATHNLRVMVGKIKRSILVKTLSNPA